MDILDDINRKKYKKKFNISPYVTIVDCILAIIILYIATFIDGFYRKLTGRDGSVVILLVSVIIYAYLIGLFTKKSVLNYNNRTYLNLKKDINDKIDRNLLGINYKNYESYKNMIDFKDRKSRYIDEYLKYYGELKSFIAKIVSSAMSSLIISFSVAIVTRRNEINVGDQLNYLGGFLLIIFLTSLILHFILIFSDIKYKYLCCKALMQIKVESI